MDFIEELKEIQKYTNVEDAHVEADNILCRVLIELEYDEIVEEYRKIDKWYN